MNKNHVFFYHIKKYHLYNSNQKIFFWKLPVTLIILQKSFWKNLSQLGFETVNYILYFLFKILIKLKKFTVLKTMSYWDHYIIINQDIFFQKLFCKIMKLKLFTKDYLLYVFYAFFFFARKWFWARVRNFVHERSECTKISLVQ